MASNVIGLFESQSVADQVAQELETVGFNRRNINRYEGSQDGLENELEREGVAGDDAAYYAEGLRSGGALVSVRANDNQVDDAVEIMNRYANSDGGLAGTGADADYTTDEASYTAGTTTDLTGTDMGTGTTGMSTVDTGVAGTGMGVTDVDTSRVADMGEGEARLAVAEEQLRVGKREVSRGGMRVRRVVTERPVEEQVVLRDETIRVDRRPVDRSASGTEDLFTEQTFEFTETDEEAVVAKEARVIEEVVVGKTVEERTETVRDTVRRSDVEVEEVGGTGTTYETDLNADYDTSSPGYVYGQTLAGDTRYTDREWTDLEGDARRDWETQNQGGVWEDVRDSVRGSWERARGRR